MTGVISTSVLDPCLCEEVVLVFGTKAVSARGDFNSKTLLHIEFFLVPIFRAVCWLSGTLAEEDFPIIC